jgi:hypothetical protein
MFCWTSTIISLGIADGCPGILNPGERLFGAPQKQWRCLGWDRPGWLNLICGADELRLSFLSGKHAKYYRRRTYILAHEPLTHHSVRAACSCYLL